MYVYKGKPSNIKQRFNNYHSAGLTQTGKLRKMKKQKYVCIDGPLKGEELTLTEPQTMVFKINNETGRYIQQNPQGRALTWEKK